LAPPQAMKIIAITNENGAGKNSRQTTAFAKKKYGNFL
jgi:hypothetical protein